MGTKTVIPKELFIGLEGVAHLCTGGEAPMLKASREALQEFCDLKSRGMPGRDRVVQVYAETKELMARHLRAPGGADDIAFLAHAAEGFNVLARGIDWRADDHIVSIRGEFPTSLLPWLARRAAGITLTAVDPGDDPEAAIEAAMTDRTRVVCVSYVSYLTGLRLDLARLAAIAHSKGAILAVDVSHALGALPIPIEHCDVLVSCCYKFMLATHGVGIFYWNRRRLAGLLQPSVGWHSIEWPTVEERSEGYRLKEGAARFELGNPSFISVFVLHEALKVLSAVDPADIENHVWELGGRLREGLDHLRLPLWTPDRKERRATNIVFGSPDCEEVVARLGQRGVLAWGSDGRVRFSLHGYNDSTDVDAALEALS